MALQAVNDEVHERYYSKAGYKNSVNFVMKVKWFEEVESSIYYGFITKEKK